MAVEALQGESEVSCSDEALSMDGWITLAFQSDWAAGHGGYGGGGGGGGGGGDDGLAKTQ